MGISLINKNEVFRMISGKKVLIERALIYNLEVLVEKLVNHAKSSAGYKDQTSNLKSSIGGVLVKDGKSVTFRGFYGKEEGISKGEGFINDLINQTGSGYTIIIVAGMEYASYVEDYHNLNVLKLSEIKMNIELPSVLQKLSQKL
ncbi:MAG: HK97 gp10 family phage protein [Bacteroidales bacterium]|nr:HK97 gp10 family phage protein [Bacteroidales bacterium]